MPSCGHVRVCGSPGEVTTRGHPVFSEFGNARTRVGASEVWDRSRLGAAWLHAQDTPFWVSWQICDCVTLTAFDSDLSWALSGYGVSVLN